jgi:hypothetical protein
MDLNQHNSRLLAIDSQTGVYIGMSNVKCILRKPENLSILSDDLRRAQ